MVKTKYFNIYIFMISILLISLMGCLPTTPESNRKITSDQSDSSSSEDPDDLGDLNFFQGNGQTTTSLFQIPGDFKDTFYLRGEEIHNYLDIESNRSSRYCLAFYFPSGSTTQLAVLSASVTNFYNFNNSRNEYYLLVDSLDSGVNSNYCSGSALTSTLASSYPSATTGFLLNGVCPNCASSIRSSAFRLFKEDGSEISSTNINISYLAIELRKATDNSNSQFCSNNSECTSINFDCCQAGQCVKDKSVKQGVDTSSTAYIAAYTEVTQNSAKYYDYPQYFYLCTTNVVPTPTPSNPDPEATAQALLTELTELYDCTTISTHEEAICTVTIQDGSTYKNVQLPSGDYSWPDDRNFSTTYTLQATAGGLSTSNITKIEYAGETLYENGTNSGGVTIDATSENDDLTSSQKITLTKDPSSSAPHDELKIKYRVDGSCEKISSTLGRCQKYYVQGQVNGSVDDHSTAAGFNEYRFYLPFYADTTKIIKVEVDNVPRSETLDWTLNTGGNNYIQFNVADKVYNGQEVVITFYVDLSTYPVMASKQTAIDKINDYCGCPSSQVCGLKPQYDSTANLIGYTCVYEQPDTPDLPLLENVYLSAKSAPVRFFSKGDGAPVDNPTLSDVANGQEGESFSYTNNDYLRPNNQGTYIGFNEIYGNLSVLSGTARAPSVIEVEVNKSYDIYVDSGAYSSCLTCGTDYYSLIAKIFPENFLFMGGGYRPDTTKTDRFATASSSVGNLRADDLLFGRACFVPATMIPWTHDERTSLQNQRVNRMDAQHFLFANGYNRDWYGFDYGSVIGSFDGVSWFSVGNQRRIRAKSSKLYLAVNSYFSDLTTEGTFRITIQENVSGGQTAIDIDSDFESDGAQCQQAHLCDDDSDCIAQLGYDYTCQSVTGIKTSWPVFDENGTEVEGETQTLNLTSILHNYEGQSKRCVYRGRGAPCYGNYTALTQATTYSQNTTWGLNACAANYYCQDVKNGVGAANAKFNTQISRFAKPPSEQNDSVYLTIGQADEVGLAARILGRPQNYIGTDSASNDILTNLDENYIEGLCLPGRDPDQTSLLLQHNTEPDSTEKGDRILAIGSTKSGNTANTAYLSSCSIMNSGNEFVHLDDSLNLSATAPSSFANQAGTQALPTNALSIFEQFDGVDILQNFNTANIDVIGHEPNRCLRAPGAVCFSDYECGPSKFVRDRVISISEDNGIINNSELNFWKEYMVCGQKASKASEDFDPTLNRCCREVGNELTISSNLNSDRTDFTSSTTNTLLTTGVPAIDFDLDNILRYSRVSTAYEQIKNNSLNPLIAPQEDTCGLAGGCGNSDLKLEKQWKTFDYIAKNSCCTQNWVRNWHETNGGGHTWSAGPGKLQNVDKANFNCINWVPSTGVNPFTCADEDCVLARTVPQNEAFDYINYFAQFDLLGIPQIMIESDDSGFDTPICPVNPTDGTSNVVSRTPFPGTIKELGSGELPEYDANLTGTQKAYSAYDLDNFDSTLKFIFDPEKISCCIPTGETVDSSVTDDMCCTGFKHPTQQRCCLNDFTDVTLYLNRYVSSEANELSDSQFDDNTGFINNPSVVQQLAATKQLCCSGTTAVGVVYSNLLLPGLPNNNTQTKRFITSNAETDNIDGAANNFDSGMRWNTHVYCVPSNFSN